MQKHRSQTLNATVTLYSTSRTLAALVAFAPPCHDEVACLVALKVRLQPVMGLERRTYLLPECRKAQRLPIFVLLCMLYLRNPQKRTRLPILLDHQKVPAWVDLVFGEEHKPLAQTPLKSVRRLPIFVKVAGCWSNLFAPRARLRTHIRVVHAVEEGHRWSLASSAQQVHR